MSKAFTKESDSDEELDLSFRKQDEDAGDSDGEDSEAEDSNEGVSSGASSSRVKNYITPSGAQKLRAELHELLHVSRPELVKVISWAASNGDRSENGDYIYGKRRLREMDRRIRFLLKRLEVAEVVEIGNRDLEKSGKILFGAQVKILSLDSGQTRVYRIVGKDEVNVPAGEISWISPLARVLLGQKVGEIVLLRAPQGEQEFEILSVEYPKDLISSTHSDSLNAQQSSE